MDKFYKVEFAEFRAYTTQSVCEQGKWEYFHNKWFLLVRTNSQTF